MKNDYTRDIASELVKKITQYEPDVRAERIGHVMSVAVIICPSKKAMR
ncbi:MAG: hypothetical protein NT149_04710 [Candidatus Gottesmanbacteria bacterium]|nr:hypothetical protein [Candidatus Gottesmanbacteria bacterium]